MQTNLWLKNEATFIGTQQGAGAFVIFSLLFGERHHDVALKGGDHLHGGNARARAAPRHFLYGHSCHSCLLQNTVHVVFVKHERVFDIDVPTAVKIRLLPAMQYHAIGEVAAGLFEHIGPLTVPAGIEGNPCLGTVLAQRGKQPGIAVFCQDEVGIVPFYFCLQTNEQ